MKKAIRSIRLLTTTAIALLLSTGVAHAALVTATVDISATDFNWYNPNPIGNPVGNVPGNDFVGSFTFTFDNGYYSYAPQAISIYSTNLPLSGNLGYTYSLGFGGLLSIHKIGEEMGALNFVANITNVLVGTPTLWDVQYGLNGYNNFISRNGTVSISQASPVPLPAAAPLLAVALGGLGFLGRRRKKV